MPITFKSEEEKDKAIDEFKEPDPSEAPVGKDIDEFMSENRTKLEELMRAEVVSDGEAEPGQTPNTSSEEKSAPVSKEVPEVKHEVSSEFETLRRRADSLEKQRDELYSQNDEKIAKLEATIEELKNSSKKNGEEPSKIDNEIDSIRNEINSLEKEMNDDTDLTPYDEEYIQKLKKTNSLSIKLNTLLTKKSTTLWEEQQREMKELKNEQRLKREKVEKEENRKSVYQEVDKFRDQFDELKSENSYAEMDEEYTKFALEVASEYYSKPQNKLTAPETEIAMQKYLKKSPVLLENLRNKGVTEPKDLRKFILLSEVNALKMGWVMDKNKGEWVEVKDYKGNKVVFPNHKAAYLHYLDENGGRKKELLNAEQKAADNIMQAVNRRAPAVELDDEHRNVDMNEMTDDTARNILEKYDEESIALRARRNFDDPLVQEYNKALIKLGYSTISKADFE